MKFNPRGDAPKQKSLNVYERTETNGYNLLMTVPNQDVWETIGKPLKEAGKELVLVDGVIVDSTYLGG